MAEHLEDIRENNVSSTRAEQGRVVLNLWSTVSSDDFCVTSLCMLIILYGNREKCGGISLLVLASSSHCLRLEDILLQDHDRTRSSPHDSDDSAPILHSSIIIGVSIAIIL